MALPISTVVITYNEEDEIQECLESISWCDEIIVVDNESTDSTREIASRIADTVIVRTVPEEATSFDILRQYGMDAATNDWILRIDADERVPRLLATTLKRIVEENKADVVDVPRKNFFLDTWYRHSWPDYTSILWKRDAIEITDQLHHGIKIREDANHLKLSPEESNALLHYTHRSYAEFVSKFWEYTGLEAEDTSPSLQILILEPGYHFLDLFVYRHVWTRGFRNVPPALGRVLTPPVTCLRRVFNI